MQYYKYLYSIILITICHSPARAIDLMDDKLNAAIVKGSECLLDIVIKHFVVSSNIALVRSGLQNYSTNRAGKYSPDVMLDVLMANPKWTIMVKQKYGYHMARDVSFTLNLK